MTKFGRISKTLIRPYALLLIYAADAKWLLRTEGLVYNASVYPESYINANK